MDIVSFEKIGAVAWDAFCIAEPEAWMRHTSEFVAFAQALSVESRDASFAVMREDNIIAVAPLVIQKNSDSDAREFAMGGTPIPFPALCDGLTEQERHEIYTRIFNEIDDIAQEHKISLLRMFLDPLTSSILEKKHKTNPLLSFGFTDTSAQTSSVDLNKSEDELLLNIQGRQRRYIRAALNLGYIVEFFDEKNITDEICVAFEKLYEKAAGRVVGTPERWKMTWDMVRKGMSIVLLVRVSGETEYCAGHVVMTYKEKAYDMLSAIAPSHRSIRGIGALMHWEIFSFLKHHGFSRHEVGWILPETSEGVYSKKELDISHFKSLFGGELLPLWRGEKLYP